MTNRYIRRYRLSPRQYVAGCPVVLSAGALLEDTKLPRLVAQLKFESISSKTISAVSVAIRCLDRAGRETERTTFCYEGLSVRRGGSFGRYTAIPLSAMETHRLRLTVDAVTFADGSVWTLPAGSVWGVLPPFREADGGYGSTKAADLWYCTCGGINRQDETCCHLCGRVCEMQFDTPADASRTENAPAGTAASGGESSNVSGKRKKGIIAIAAAAAVVVVAAAVLLLPKGGERPAESGSANSILDGITEAIKVQEPYVYVAPHVTTPSDKGTVYLEMTQEPGQNYCKVTIEQLQILVPEMVYFDSADSPSLGDDIDSYLSISYPMLCLISSGGKEAGGSHYNHIYIGENMATTSLMLLSDTMRLCGYFVGQPEELGDGKWRMPITLCDYDFSVLYERQAAAFEKAKTEDYPYIAHQDVESCGAKSFFFGYSTGYMWEETQTQQLYFIWAQMNSSAAEHYRKSMDQLEGRKPSSDSDENLWRYFVFLDDNDQVLGYTVFSSEDGKLPDNSGSTRWDGSAATSFGGGSGIAQDPYLIKTAQQLAYLAKVNNESENGIVGCFRLEADLDLNNIEWTPIGNWNNSFRGTFDGNGHTIRGLYVSKGDYYSQVNDNGKWECRTAGLFGNGYRVTIKDLTVEGAINISQQDTAFDGSVYAAGIIGSTGSYATIVNCHNRCNITVEERSQKSNVQLGGIAGNCSPNSLIDGCSNTGDLTVQSASYAQAGGILANASDCKLVNCWNTGSVAVKVSDNTGGSAGGILASGGSVLVGNCCNLGAVKGPNQAGGIGAYLYTWDEAQQEPLAANIYSTGNITVTRSNGSRTPIGSLFAEIREGYQTVHCFYPESGPAPVKSGSEVQIPDAQRFKADGTFASGHMLINVLNNWVDANNADGLYAHWVMDDTSGLPVPDRVK